MSLVKLSCIHTDPTHLIYVTEVFDMPLQVGP
jgi:hypothetical protein